jgi:hypothetical protein
LSEQRLDGCVSLSHGVEDPVSQRRQDPAPHHLDRALHRRLVLRVVGARWQHRGAIVTREVQHRGIGLGLVAVGLGDESARVVGHDQVRHRAHEGDRAHHALDPVVELLRRGGAGEGVAGSAHGRDEDLSATALAQPQRRAGVVHEQLLASTPVLAHRALEPSAEYLVMLAELGVAPGAATGVGLGVFLPQQHQRHALALQVLVHASPVGLDEARGQARGGQQGLLQARLIPVAHLVPVQTGGAGQRQVLLHHALGDTQGGCDLVVGQTGFPLQSNDILDHA